MLAFGVSGCISVEAEIPETQVTRQNLSFPGLPPEVPTSIPANATPEVLAALGITADGVFHLPVLTFSYDGTPINAPAGLSSTMHMKSVTISAHDGTADLSFVRRLTLTVTNSDRNAGEPQILLEYPNAESPSEPLQKSLTMPVIGLDDVIDPWKPQPGIYALNVWGDLFSLPRRPWAVDVTLTLSGSVAYEF